MTQKLFIPKRIRVGFQTRPDTFTKRLAYVIYYDEKGKLRKETSWEGWRDTKIEAVEFDNVPTPNFVLNKGVQRDGHWGSGRSVVRIHDPREFEFEISVDNLIGLLMHSDVSKRDIAESCVYAWAGTELVLLPVNSTDYEASVQYTSDQDVVLTTKHLVPGQMYTKKKSHAVNEAYTYIGFLPWYAWTQNEDVVTHSNKGKKHVFYATHGGYRDGFEIPSVSTLKATGTTDDKFAQYSEAFFSTDSSQLVVGVSLVPLIDNDNRFTSVGTTIDANGKFFYVGSSYMVQNPIKHSQITDNT